MKRIALVVIAVCLIVGTAQGTYLGVLTTSDNAVFPVFCFDTTSAFSVDAPDSFTVIVWHEDVGDNSYTYFASGNTEVAWISAMECGGGDTTWVFRDAVADIDEGAGDGMYTGVVYAWKTTKRTPTPFSFYLSASNTNTIYDRIDSVRIHTLQVVSDVHEIRGDSTAAHHLGEAYNGDATGGNVRFGTVTAGATTFGSTFDITGAVTLSSNLTISGDATGLLGDSTLNDIAMLGNAHPTDSTNIAAVKAKTDNLPTDPADDSDIDGQLAAIQTGIDSSAAHVSRPGNAYATDSALLVQAYYRTDSIADTVIAHAPHGDNWASAGEASVPDSVAAVARLVNSYPTDSALLVQTYYRTDSIADTVIAHAPHGDNWASAGEASVPDSVAAVARLVNSYGTDSALWVAINAKTTNLPTDPADDSDIDGQLAAIQTGIDSSAAHVSRPGNAYANDSALWVAINAKTTNLPTDPADDSDIDGQLAALQTGLDSTSGLVAPVGNAHTTDSTNIAAIKAKTDNLPTDPADDSDIDGQLAAIQTGIDSTAGLVAPVGNWHATDSTYTVEMHDSLGSQGWAATEGVPDSTANDIAMMGNWHATDSTYSVEMHDSLGSQAWATSGSASVPDSVAAVARLVNSYATDSALWVNAGAGADTIIAHAPHADNWGGTGAAGTGDQTLALYVIDTSGTDAVVSGVTVTTYSSDQSATINQGLSNSDGVVLAGTDTLNTTASTSYVAKGGKTGYIIPVHSFTTGSASRFQDTMFCYDISIGAVSAASLKRVYVDVGTLLGDSMMARGAMVYVDFIAPQNDTIPYDTATSELVGMEQTTLAVPANGYVNGTGSYIGPSSRALVELRRTDYMLPYGCKYRFVVKDRRGKTLLEKTVAVSGASASNLVDLVN